MNITLQLGLWHWLIVGFLLLALEMLVPAMVLIWFGIGAIVTGILLALIPGLSVGIQILVFALLSVGSLVIWRKTHPEQSVTSDTPELNNRLHSHIGKEYVLSEAIINGRGSMRVGDTAWRVQGPDLPAGTRVRVTGVSGVIFTVEAVTPHP